MLELKVKRFIASKRTFKRCFPRGGRRHPYVVGKTFSEEVMSNNFSKAPNMITGILVSSLKRQSSIILNMSVDRCITVHMIKRMHLVENIRVTSAKQTNNMSKLIESIKKHSPKLSSIPSTVSGLAVTSVPWLKLLLNA